ncbi:hypothetical protein [Nocardiopsis alba]|uniref:hypothetical protein n=1 Tax=Nocardiopsis alba TaxID=53437 RepID=UPI0033B01A7C
MKRALLPVVALSGLLALSACGTAPSESSRSEGAGAGASAPNVEGSEGSGNGEGGATVEGSGATEETVTVAYEDDRRSVFTLDLAQVEDFTGRAVEEDAFADIVDLLAEESRWTDDAETGPYASLIATAFSRESESANGALYAITEADDARLRVQVVHNGHANVAHVGVEHSNG